MPLSPLPLSFAESYKVGGEGLISDANTNTHCFSPSTQSVSSAGEQASRRAGELSTSSLPQSSLPGKWLSPTGISQSSLASTSRQRRLLPCDLCQQASAKESAVESVFALEWPRSHAYPGRVSAGPSTVSPTQRAAHAADAADATPPSRQAKTSIKTTGKTMWPAVRCVRDDSMAAWRFGCCCRVVVVQMSRSGRAPVPQLSVPLVLSACTLARSPGSPRSDLISAWRAWARDAVQSSRELLALPAPPCVATA
jgi:hypothetical protein